MLSNLGMSYVLSKQLAKAEETLRRAQARARADDGIRQNLALAIGLQGRLGEAESIVARPICRRTRPPKTSAYLKQMLSRKDNPRTASRNGKPPVVAFDQAERLICRATPTAVITRACG